mmetsp:Transcript_45717/g.92288  ORF Transcript_45717/g.92288 Transcript_45717/m.92288 type:complete len:201 (+) Transcript_45717:19-621(+)
MPPLPVLYLDGVLKHKALLLQALQSTSTGINSSTSKLTFKCDLFRATVGQHLRHSLTHVRKLVSSIETPSTVVAYDERSRGTQIENSSLAAAVEVIALRQTLMTNATNMTSPVSIEFMFGTEPASTSPSATLNMTSSLERELAFVAHHAIHHNASILMIIRNNPLLFEDLSSRLLETAPDFGMAPSTVAFQKEETNAPIR